MDSCSQPICQHRLLMVRNPFHAALLSVMLCVSVPSDAVAEFVPGRVYIADTSFENCNQPAPHDRDLIWEVDPLTGAARVFSEIGPGSCGTMYGLAMSPDGSALRAAMFYRNEIRAIDGDGNHSVALNGSDGIAGPAGSNGVAYDAAGNFYVSNENRTILRYPADGGPGEIFSNSTLLTGASAIAPDLNGGLYYMRRVNSVARILHIRADGTESLFNDTFPSYQWGAITVDDRGDLYA